MRAQFVLSEIMIGLRRNLTMTIAVIISAAVALGMLGVALLMLFQVDNMKGYWYDKIEVSVFMCTVDENTPACPKTATDQKTIDALQADIGANPLVAKVTQESSVEAYAHYQEQFKGSPIGAYLTPNQLPASLRVKLKDPTPEHILAIMGEYQQRPGVDQVQDQRALLKPLFSLFNGMKFAAIAVAAVMMVLALMLIVNTVRLSAFSRRRETGIMRLVGASNLYIRLPFLMEGAIAGLAGVALATLGICGVQYFLIDHMLASSFKLTPWVGWSSVLKAVGWILPTGLLMSVGASALSLRKYLKI